MNINQIPRPLLVALVLVVGVALFFVIQEPHSVCDSQIEVFKESQKGKLFSYRVKTSVKAPLYSKYVETCKLGNSPGACYELFALLRDLSRNWMALPVECFADIGEVAEVKKAVTEGLELMVLLAWGDRPPEQGIEKLNWLEASDIALFCELKTGFLRMFGNEGLMALRAMVAKKLPGETPLIKEGLCYNCSSLKTADQVFSSEEIWARSLFSVRCDQYR